MQTITAWCVSSIVLTWIAFVATLGLSVTITVVQLAAGRRLDRAKARDASLVDPTPIVETIGKIVDTISNASPLGTLAILTVVFYGGTILSVWILAGSLHAK
jgi:hypothetical protein